MEKKYHIHVRSRKRIPIISLSFNFMILHKNWIISTERVKQVIQRLLLLSFIRNLSFYRFISFIPFITKIHVSSLAKPSKDLGDYVNVVDEDRLRTINSRCKCQSVRSILRNDRLSKSTRTVEYFLVFGNTLKKRRTVLEYYFLYTIRRLIFFPAS